MLHAFRDVKSLELLGIAEELRISSSSQLEVHLWTSFLSSPSIPIPTCFFTITRPWLSDQVLLRTSSAVEDEAAAPTAADLADEVADTAAFAEPAVTIPAAPASTAAAATEEAQAPQTTAEVAMAQDSQPTTATWTLSRDVTRARRRLTATMSATGFVCFATTCHVRTIASRAARLLTPTQKGFASRPRAIDRRC